MSEQKGKYFNPERAAVLAELNTVNEEMAEAMLSGDIDRAKELAPVSKDLQARLSAGGRGSSNEITLEESIFESLPEVKTGEYVIAIKTALVTRAIKVSMKETSKKSYAVITHEDVFGE